MLKDSLNKHGYVIIPNFLSEDELSGIISDYHAQKHTVGQNKTVNIFLLSDQYREYVGKKIIHLYNEQFEDPNSTNKIDTLFPYASYVDNKLVNVPWHQDVETSFLFQTWDYLRAYIPIIKPDRLLSGISMVSNQTIRDMGKEYEDELLERSATLLFNLGDGTAKYEDEDSGSKKIIPLDLAKNKVNLDIGPGDLVLFRGDTIHRTQDTLTHRVSITLSCMRSNGVIQKDYLTNAGGKREVYMKNNPKPYQRIVDKFEEKNVTEMTLGEVYTNRIIS